AMFAAYPAFASDPHEAPAQVETEAHADDAHGGGDAHADEGGHEGEAGAHGYDWTADGDGDGVPNWTDPTDHEAVNEHFVWKPLGWHTFNLLLLLIAIVYAARRPVGDQLKNRAYDMRKELTDAARERDEARQRHEELGSRLSHFEEEVTTLKEEAIVAAKQEEEQLVARAHVEAQRIHDTAEKNIHEELIRARETLRRDAVDLAVDLAEGTLKKQVMRDDRRRLSREFLDALQSDGGNGNG
ncbi:MAG: ATP synthase F0 subunit B, partial [Deltaproteobacteria bacterium]|nr:ATP synthase F0 subunit B [Deltaproteobacteria bacterium]